MMEMLEKFVVEKNAKKITHVKLRVGKLSGAEPELLKSAFDILKRGTFANDAELEMEIVSLKVKCGECNNVFEAEDFTFICPFCGSQKCELLEGEELILERIELEI